MVVKTIKPGNIEVLDPTLSATCDKCGCEFEFNASDARYQSDQRDGDAYIINCPFGQCGKELWISTAAARRKPIHGHR
jgi:hypothetical protein